MSRMVENLVPAGTAQATGNATVRAQGRLASPRVTIAVVTYRSRPELPGCLDSILASSIPAKVVVIDNGSSDGTLELAQQYALKHDNVVALASGGNIGLSAANNLVMPHLEGDYVLILNPDTVLQPDTLATLVGAMDRDSTIGAIGPKCVYEDGTPHTSYHYGWTLWHLIVWRMLPYSLIRKLYDRYARYAEKEVGFVSGACLLTRAEVFREIRGYDPAYFLTVEDACDLCNRIRATGHRIVFSPSTQITHLCSRSGLRVPYLSALEAYKGDIYHFFKYHGMAGGLLAFTVVVIACALKVGVSLSKVILYRRPVDRENLRVYCRILPQLLSRGPKIAYSVQR
jgi:GT2 family glycosyltransferase